MPALSEWLQIMLGEITRKREDVERARDEDAKRRAEASGAVVHLDPKSRERSTRR